MRKKEEKVYLVAMKKRQTNCRSEQGGTAVVHGDFEQISIVLMSRLVLCWLARDSLYKIYLFYQKMLI